jgi:hypothetical protein
MIKVQRYKLFFNSKAFEKIYNQSISEIVKYSGNSYDVFFREVVKVSLDKGFCFILFEDEEPIGYEIIKIKNKKVDGGFTFILPKHRGKKYSYLLRESMFNLIKDEVDEFSTYIHNSNISSIESAKKTAKKLFLNLKISNTIIMPDGTNKNMKKYTIIP